MKKGKNKKRTPLAKGEAGSKHWTKKKGGGVITLEVYTDDNEDNGRVLGYDNAHGEHHRHYFGNYEPIEFDSIEAVIDRFYGEWMEIVNEHNPYQR